MLVCSKMCNPVVRMLSQISTQPPTLIKNETVDISMSTMIRVAFTIGIIK